MYVVEINQVVHLLLTWLLEWRDICLLLTCSGICFAILQLFMRVYYKLPSGLVL